MSSLRELIQLPQLLQSSPPKRPGLRPGRGCALPAWGSVPGGARYAVSLQRPNPKICQESVQKSKVTTQQNKQLPSQTHRRNLAGFIAGFDILKIEGKKRRGRLPRRPFPFALAAEPARQARQSKACRASILECDTWTTSIAESNT
jgi:hypothetical protein